MTKTDSEREEVLFALLAYILHIFGAAYVLYAKKDKPFANYHAKQSLVLCLMWIISGVVVSVAMMLPFLARLWPIMVLIHLFFLSLLIIGVFNALLGKKNPLPLIGKLAEEVKL